MFVGARIIIKAKGKTGVKYNPNEQFFHGPIKYKDCVVLNFSLLIVSELTLGGACVIRI